tara:strand:+ start:3833 stop:4222 length:390 start_codon:yes stop_codon:yes gene_type:complete
MGIFSKHIPPHKLHPEILHWQEGDEIKARNVVLNNPLSIIVAFEDGNLNIIYNFKAITRDGFIIISEKETEQLHKVPFKKFIKTAKNLSLINRTIQQDLVHNQDYMELIESFQTAYKELEESDNPKLID